MTNIPLQLNWEMLREQSNIWIRRASVFMGIGTNVAKIDPPVRHVLDDRAQYIFVTSTPTLEESRAFVNEFETWVISNGLRELIEGHSTFLHSAFHGVKLLIAGEMRVEALQKLAQAFERKNVIEQRTELAKDLGITDHFEPMFSSMVIARNCLAHRNGIVGANDINTDGDEYELCWRFIGVKYDDDGRQLFADLNGEGEPIVFRKETTLKVGPVEKSKRFKLGQQIRLTRHDLAEIVFGCSIAAESIVEPMMQLAKAKGLMAEGAADTEPGPPVAAAVPKPT